MATIDRARWHALTPFLEGLLDADDAERRERLARIAERDGVLGAELSALLALQARIETEGFLESGPLEGVAHRLTLAGKTLGNYTLEREVGAGGMGTVWLARRSDGRYQGNVAVKLLNLGLIGRAGVERFRREGHALARLAHPNIARLVDAGDVDGHPYLVIDYVDGLPIDAWCDARSLGVEGRVRLLLQVLAAVAYAHSRLILHRDLKPSNIIVAADGDVKLLDFGIAKLLDDASGPAARTELTQLGGRALTPECAAPEQVQGADVSTATDVYALGVLLYQLLTGVHPTSQPSMTHIERLRAIVEDEPRRASEAARGAGAESAALRGATPDRLARALRGDFDNIVAKALKKLPSERYASVEALAADLQRVLAHRPVSVRADSRVYRAAKFVRRNRLATGAGAAMLLFIAAGITGTTWQAIEARRERDEALRQEQMSRAKGNLVNLIWSAISEEERPLTQREILARSTHLVSSQFGNQPGIAAQLLLPIAGQYFTLGDVEKDLETMTLAAGFARASGDPELIAQVACDTVNSEIRRANVDRAREHLRTARAALERVVRPHAPTIIECLRAEADIADAAGETREAIRYATLALTEAERALPGGENVYRNVLSLLAVLHLKNNDLPAGYALVKKYEARNERFGQTNDSDYLAMLRSEALILMAWGEYRAAQSILDALAAKLPDPPPWLGRALGQLLARKGDLAGARETLGRAAALSRAQGHSEQTAKIELWLALMLAKSKRFDDARSLLARVEAALPSVDLDQPITAGIVRSALLLEEGSLVAAEQAIASDLDRLGHRGADASPALGAALLAAARITAAGDDASRALHAAQKALAVTRRVARDAANSADVGEALLLVARAQRRLGETKEAIATLARAATSLAGGLGESHPLVQEALQLTRDLVGEAHPPQVDRRSRSVRGFERASMITPQSGSATTSRRRRGIVTLPL